MATHNRNNLSDADSLVSGCPPSTIAIIGSGCSGSLVAAQLLHRATGPLVIKLIERTPQLGRGVAYSTPFNCHLLNVPAREMSAFPDQPGHFLSWAQTQEQSDNGSSASGVNADTFVPRKIYGSYLQSVLAEAEASAPDLVCLERINDEAVGIVPGPDHATIHLKSHQVLQADRVVLGLGNFHPSPPPVKTDTFYHSRRYIGSAWSFAALSAVDPEEAILLIGSGLTAIDLALALEAQGHRGAIHLVSRHGLLPHSHRTKTPYTDFDITTAPPTIRALVRQIRQLVELSAAQGQDWRAVVDSLRPVTQQLWQSFSLDEKRRFLRHVRPYWEVHRHRIAPEVAEIVNRLQHSGQLVVHAGRLQSYYEDSSGVEVTLRQRHGTSQTTLRVSQVVNCTGPTSNYQKLQHPLVVNLRAQGLLCPDELALGFKTASKGALLDTTGVASTYLYTLGPPRKANLWETVAVPEIRVQALALAQELLCSLDFNRVEQETALKPGFVVPAKIRGMLFRQLFDPHSSTYTYLIADLETRMAILVDPVLEQMERDYQLLKELELTLCYCLETHIHADHITSAGKLRGMTECQCILPAGAEAITADRYIADGEILQLGSIPVEAIATPGHTDSHVAYRVNTDRVLTGDALFIRGCGRTDFQGGDAETLYNSVTQRLFTLPEETLVYPGHDYRGHMVSSIGEEKYWNPRFARRDRHSFVELMQSLKLANPKKMMEAIPANQTCGSVLPIQP